MNSAFLITKKSLFAALLAVSSVALSATVMAAEGPAPAAPTATAPDAAKGATLYGAGDAARGIPACTSCHGDAGNSTIATNPKLAAQHEAYIVKQLTNFKSGERANPIMGPYAKQLTDDEMRNLAAFLSAQTLKPSAAKNKDTVDLGKKIFRAGIKEKNVPACAACHGPAGAGIPAQFARLGGQHADYTEAQLNGFSSGARANNPIMTTIASRMSAAEMKAVSDYIAGLR
ncbi:MAG TPA: c-type cytochrome [Burkholderiaceae bacterium]|jgi:cytochrome c553